MGFGWSRGGGAPLEFVSAPGASVDGATDAAAAIASASASAVSAGKPLLFRKGLYGLSSLDVPDGATWVFQPGARLVLSQTFTSISIRGRMSWPFVCNRLRGRVAALGDSRIALSGTTLGSDRFPSWLSIVSNGNIMISGFDNGAVGGSTTADLSSQIATLAARDVRYNSVLMLTGTNDGTSVTADAAFANVLNAWFEVLSNGWGVQHVCCLPRDLSSWDADREMRREHNNLRLTAAAAKMDAVSVYSVERLLVDASTSDNDVDDDLFLDSVHPNTLGAYTIANELITLSGENTAQKGNGILGNQYYDATDNPYGNIFPNEMLRGTGGSSGGATAQRTIAGDIPDNCYITGNNGEGSIVSSVEARADGVPGNWWKLVITAAGGQTCGAELSFFYTTPNVGDSDPDQIGGFDIWVPSGSDEPGFFTCQLVRQGAARTQVLYTVSQFEAFPVPLTGRVILGPVPPQGNETTTTGSIRLNVRTRTAEAVTVYLGLPFLRFNLLD